MEIYEWIKPLLEERVYSNKMLSFAVVEGQTSEFIFNEGITYGREQREKELNEKIRTIERKQKHLSAALVMIKKIHLQPCELKEILLWLVEFCENKENENELMEAYEVVNFTSNSNLGKHNR